LLTINSFNVFINVLLHIKPAHNLALRSRKFSSIFFHQNFRFNFSPASRNFPDCSAGSPRLSDEYWWQCLFSSYF